MGVAAKNYLLDRILEKAYIEDPLNREELKFLVGLTNEKDIEEVFRTARSLRRRYFGDKVFLYGFVYFSTYCKNDCNFCLYRKSNSSLARYRKKTSEILETAHRLVESGVHLLDLTMGEDPEYLSAGCFGTEKLFRTIEAVKKNTEVPIMVSPGVVSDSTLDEFGKIGVDWYACYQETHNRELYSNLRINQSYDQRMEKKLLAKKKGLLIEEGLLAGVGESDDDVVLSLEAAKKLAIDQIRVMSFVPQKGTPMNAWPNVPRLRELLIMAVMRLVFPDRLIPASLDVDGLTGMMQRIDAGANVVTSIIPPLSGLAGVSQSSLDIEEGKRTVSSVLPVLEAADLVPAQLEEYSMWVCGRQSLILN